jgi:hypothetical protein
LLVNLKLQPSREAIAEKMGRQKLKAVELVADMSDLRLDQAEIQQRKGEALPEQVVTLCRADVDQRTGRG